MHRLSHRFARRGFVSRGWRGTLLYTSMAVFATVAQAQSGGLTPLQVSKLQSVTSAVISDDGKYVAYTLSVPADPQKSNARAASHLYLIDRDAQSYAALYTGASVGQVEFRPGKGTITFLATIEKGEKRALYEIPVTGGTPTKLWSFNRPISAYAWAPDGNRIGIMAMDSVVPPASPMEYRPKVFEENLVQRRGYVADVTQASAAPRRIELEGSIYMMSWNPSGDKLAISIAPTSAVDDFYMFQAVKVLDANTLQIAADIDNKGKLGQIVWSPDGQQIALRAGNDINDPIDGSIMIVSANGGTPQNIYRDFEGKFERIDWTGANEIQFVASESAETSYGTVQPDGGNFTRIVSQPGLALTSFSRASNGRIAFVAQTSRHPGEVFLMDAGQTTPGRISNSNAWLTDVTLGEQRVVRYPARDGQFEIDGILILPVGYQEGTRVPLITVVHGGPESHYLNGWITNYSNPGQMAAARGYAVFYPNYRGSTGRGIEFGMVSQGDAGGKEFDDVVDGVDYLIASGIADSARIGVTGGSYGGYATAWMSTKYSHRFAAGVMFVGISNDISKWGTSDIPHELHLVHSRENIWEGNWQKYLERSPIYHVDNSQTPLLIMHGENDTRVHPSQSLELYRHIKVRKPEVPLRLIFYPGEGHGNARASSRFDYSLRMMGWFDAFLKGDKQKPSLDLDMSMAN